jgi:hypothetical protein
VGFMPMTPKAIMVLSYLYFSQKIDICFGKFLKQSVKHGKGSMTKEEGKEIVSQRSA